MNNELDIKINLFQQELSTIINKSLSQLSPGICLLILQKLTKKIQEYYIANINSYYIEHPKAEKQTSIQEENKI